MFYQLSIREQSKIDFKTHPLCKLKLAGTSAKSLPLSANSMIKSFKIIINLIISFITALLWFESIKKFIYIPNNRPYFLSYLVRVFLTVQPQTIIWTWAWFTWKSTCRQDTSSCEWLHTKTDFDTEIQGNAEMAYTCTLLTLYPSKTRESTSLQSVSTNLLAVQTYNSASCWWPEAVVNGELLHAQYNELNFPKVNISCMWPWKQAFTGSQNLKSGCPKRTLGPAQLSKNIYKAAYEK